MKKWLRRRIFKRLLKVENLNISRTERKIKRTAYWMTIATLSWGIPFTTDFTEHWVFENPSSVVSESVRPENSADILAVGTDTGDDVVQSGDESEGKVEALIAEAFPEDVSKVMVAIAKAESGLNPKATNYNKNGTMDIGLFQINTIHGYDQLELFNPEKNIEAAKSVYEKQGLMAWTVFKNKRYLDFM